MIELCSECFFVCLCLLVFLGGRFFFFFWVCWIKLVHPVEDGHARTRKEV